MGYFDMFIQPNGPTIDMNLFADSASKGIDAGKALGTKTSNIIQGAMAGLQGGQQMYNSFQQGRLLDAEVAAVPVQNEIRQALLDVQKAKLQSEANPNSAENIKAQQEAYQARGTQLLSESLNSNNLEGISAFLTDNSTESFRADSRNKDLVERAESIFTAQGAPELVIPYQKQKEIRLKNEDYAKNKVKYEEDYNKNLSQLDSDGILSTISASTRLPVGDVLGSISIKPAGAFKLEGGSLVAQNIGTSEGKNDVWYTPIGGTPELVLGGESADRVAVIARAQSARNLALGDSLQKQVEQVESKYKSDSTPITEKDLMPAVAPQIAKTTTNLTKPTDKLNVSASQELDKIDILDTTNNTFNLVNNTNIRNNFQATLGIDSKLAPRVEVFVDELLGGLNGKNRLSDTDITDRLSSISKIKLAANFKKSKELQAQYSDQEVEKHNKLVDTAEAIIRNTPIKDKSLEAEARNAVFNSGMSLQKVSSGVDLYTMKQLPAYLSVGNTWVKQVRKKMVKDSQSQYSASNKVNNLINIGGF